MRQYRWFNNRVGQKVYARKGNAYEEIEVKDKDHAFELWKDARIYTEPKEYYRLYKKYINEDQLIKKGIKYAKKHLKKVFQELEKED